jgi:outer membrane protein assembly factor BamB
MHVDTRNSDEIWSVAAPVVHYEWTAEPELYVAEGPTFDNEGNLYFAPVSAREDVSLVSLDRETGRRRWSIPGRGAGCGAPLVLNDPDDPPRQQIYHSTYTTAMALRSDGSVIWSAPTGLLLPPRRPGERDQTHVWGMSYHPQADAVFGVTMDGFVFAHDRKSGAPLLRAPFRLPGAPAAASGEVPAWLARRANRETDAAFGSTADGVGLFSSILDTVFGRGVRVANFYAIDPGSGRIFIAATAPDEQDGATDGVSRNGALYALELRGERPGGYELAIVRSFEFDGGTGSTPTLSAAGDSVIVSDDNGFVIALDRDLRERWRVDVGSQVAASIAVSAENRELYAVTRFDVIKLFDRGANAEIAWRATLDAFPGFENFNALTPTLTANGVVVSVGGGRMLGSQQLMTKFGMGLLDRETGLLRSFAEGREESIAVSAVGPDGGFYIAGSPVRRAVARALLGDAVPPLVGGIQRYRPIRLDLLARDAVCAASQRAARLAGAGVEASAHATEVRQIRVLLRQARVAVPAAVVRGDILDPSGVEIGALLREEELDSMTMQRLCERLEALGAERNRTSTQAQ